jgi:aminocarboxymuconate-semialdehyde decarboxylase
VSYLKGRDLPPYVRTVAGVERFMLFPGDRGVPMTADFVDSAAKLQFMDRVGIQHSILSVGNPWLDLDPGPQTIALAAALNREMCDLADSAEGRLSTLAILPNHDVGSALRCVEAVAAEGRSVGVITGTRVCQIELDRPELAPLWALLAEAELPVLVHPQAGLAGEATRGYGQALTLALSFPFETTTAIARMVLAGTFTRNAALKVVAAHGAGTLPYLFGRLHRAVAVDPDGSEAAQHLAATPPPGLYADSILFSASTLEHCVRLLGADHVLLGTDHPFPIADGIGALADIAAATVGRSGDYARIAGGNAAELFRLDRRTVTA